MSKLIQVWGDTVDTRHMSASIALGVGIATPTFLIGRSIFEATVQDQSLAKSYALLVGLAGCLVAAVIAARLFKPKRVVREAQATSESRLAAIEDIRESGGVWTDPAELDEQVQQELRRLGLYDALREAHVRGEGEEIRT